MASADTYQILTVNSGSSSIKFSLYRLGAAEELLLVGMLDRIGVEGGHFRAQDQAGKTLVKREIKLPDHEAALQVLFKWLQDEQVSTDLAAVGHRLVHGGRGHRKTQKITPQTLGDIKKLIPLAPDHLPQEIRAIEVVSKLFPELVQVACFDTAFHRQMPKVAQDYPLPESFTREEVIRYGFHGLSYEYLLMELAREAGAAAAQGRVIMAHLGNGASMAALHGGQSLDTTMGMTPTGGLVMSTRSGDLDPGVILYLLRERGMSVSAVNQLLNKEAGLLGVSGFSSDMQDLLDREPTEAGAAAAVELFCYTARKFLGAFSAVLGGLDTLVFTGGIGENASAIRARICHNLGFLGVALDDQQNADNAPIIS
ncbi:MAG: acetate/propionate family kinase, partial [Deltaproteobacteria bacterium]